MQAERSKKACGLMTNVTLCFADHLSLHILGQCAGAHHPYISKIDSALTSDAPNRAATAPRDRSHAKAASVMQTADEALS